MLVKHDGTVYDRRFLRAGLVWLVIIVPGAAF